MRKLILFCACGVLLSAAEYPGAHCEKPSRAGWSEPLLKATRDRPEHLRRVRAAPIGTEDYVVGDGRFAGAEGSVLPGDSVFLNYIFSMTARDIARFGYLYLRYGRWGDRLVIPADWVTRSSTRTRSSIPIVPLARRPAMDFCGELKIGGYAALAGGHIIAIVPGKGLVIVHRVVYDLPQEYVVAHRDVDTMIRMVIATAPSVNPVK